MISDFRPNEASKAFFQIQIDMRSNNAATIRNFLCWLIDTDTIVDWKKVGKLSLMTMRARVDSDHN